jgi:hypothetical protein
MVGNQRGDSTRLSDGRCGEGLGHTPFDDGRRLLTTTHDGSRRVTTSWVNDGSRATVRQRVTSHSIAVPIGTRTGGQGTSDCGEGVRRGRQEGGVCHLRG